MKGKKRGISAIVGTLIFLQILLVSVVLVIYVTNHQTTATERSIASLQKSTHGVIYEKYENGQTYLIVTQPTNITHIIYPNDTVKNTSITVVSQINVNEILNGQPWAVITTSQGEWFNVTAITLPQIVDDPVSSVCLGGGVGTNVGSSPDWNIIKGPTGEYYCHHSNTTSYGNQTHPNTSVLVTVYNYGNSSTAMNYNVTGIHHVTVWNPYWVWAVEQLETNKYSFPFNGGNQTGGYFPFNATMFDPWGQYYYYYLLVTSSLLPTLNMPLYYSAYYYLAPMYWNPNPGDVQEKNITITVCYVYDKQNNYQNYTIGEELIINNPPGGIEFSYDYINNTIAAYVPVSTNTNIYYVYYYFDNFEIYNLSALVPNQIVIMQFHKLLAFHKGYIDSAYAVSVPPGVPKQYLDVNNFHNSSGTYFYVNFTYSNTTVNVNGAEWVHNLVLSAGSSKYVPANVSDSALTTPLLPAPSTGGITQAYTLLYAKPPVTYTVNEYPNGSFSYAPYYLNFPATGYGGFPSYFGQYVLPAYGVTVGSPTSLYYATQWFGGYVGNGHSGFNVTGYAYGYIADTVWGNFSKPITNFELWITPNLHLWDAGLIQGELQQPGSSSWEAYYGVPIGNWQIVTYMPVYIVVPGGTYVENVSEGVFVS